MGGSTVVIVESALQDLCWQLVRMRAPPDVQAAVRSRLQRLMSDVSLSEQMRAREAEESPEQFINGLVYDMVDTVCHEKIPFVEVQRAKAELERVSASNELLKMRLQENQELDQLRELALLRKTDALVYTTHKYFEEVFVLRRERHKLVNLVRQAQSKAKELQRAATSRSDEDDNILHLSPSTIGPGFLGAVLDRVDQKQHDGPTAAATSFNSSLSITQTLQRTLVGAATTTSVVAASAGADQNVFHHQFGQSHQSAFLQSTLDHIREEHTAPKTDTMAIFSYDELAVRLMLDDPDLAQMKMQNVKLCRQLEEVRIASAVQKRRLSEEYEAKMRSLEARLHVAIGENSDGGQVTVAKVAKELLGPLQRSVRTAAEGFRRDREQMREALAGFGDALHAATQSISEGMEQQVSDEEVHIKQMQLATDYIDTMCSGAEEEIELEEDATETDVQHDDDEEENNSSNVKKRKLVKVTAREAARKRFESCLEPAATKKKKKGNDEDDEDDDDEEETVVTKKSKRFWQQHELTAYLRSSIAAVGKSTHAFGDLLERLTILSEYATRERAQQACLELQDEYRDKRRRAKDGGGGFGKESDDANATLVALSAAAKVSSSPMMYRKLFRMARAEAEEAERHKKEDGNDDDDDESSSGVIMAEDRDKILAAEVLLRKHVRDHVVASRFARLAERIRRKRMLRVYDSFREFVDRREVGESVADEDEERTESVSTPLPHSWTATGPFADADAFAAWRARLVRRGQLHDEDFDAIIADARGQVKLIVTDLVATLPSGLLALFVSDKGYSPYSWSDPFQDQSGAFDNDEEPSPFEAGEWPGASSGAGGGGASSSSSGAKRTRGSGMMPRRIVCPHCGEVITGADLSASASSSSSSSSRLLGRISRKQSAGVGPGEAALIRRRSRSASGSAAGGGAAGGDGDDVSSSAAERRKSESRQRVIRFSPAVQEVQPDEMIPVAAPANRHGFFLPHPPSRTGGGGGKSSSRGGGGDSDSVSVSSGITPSSPMPSTQSAAERVMEVIRFGPAPVSILRGGKLYEQQQHGASPEASPAAVNPCVNTISFGVGSLSTSQQQQQRQGTGRPPSAEQALINSLLTLTGGRAGGGGGGGRSVEHAQVSVTAALQSLESCIPGEEEPQSGFIDDSKLLLIRRLRGQSSPVPSIVSTMVGLTGSVELAQKSMDLSVRHAARQFVGRTLLMAAANNAPSNSASPIPMPPASASRSVSMASEGTVLEKMQQEDAVKDYLEMK